MINIAKVKQIMFLSKQNVIFLHNNKIIEIENPVQQYATDADLYIAYMDVLNNIVQTLGEGYALQKQDVLCKQAYHHDITPDMEFLSKSYFKFFEGRPYTEIRTYLIITQEIIKSSFIKYDPKKWMDLHTKVAKVVDILKERGLWYHKLGKAEVDEYLHRFMAFNFKNGPFSMQNFKSSDECLRMGDRVVKSFDIVDIDEIDLPTLIRPFQPVNVNGYTIATDLLAFLSDIPFTDYSLTPDPSPVGRGVDYNDKQSEAIIACHTFYSPRHLERG